MGLNNHSCLNCIKSGFQVAVSSCLIFYLFVVQQLHSSRTLPSIEHRM